MIAFGTLRPGSERANHVVPQDLPPVVINDASLPLISIVTPSFNQGHFIRETVESVLNQDYPNIEYWVIDGGSTDETLSVLKEYEHDPRFHWISEKDKGQSDAINKGLARCRGELFNWLCSDDLLLPGAMRRVIETWRALHCPSAVYGWARLIDQYGNDLGYCPLQSSRVSLGKMLRFDSFPMQQATFVPTQTLRAAGGVDPSLQFAMDVDLWVRLIQKIPFHHIAADLASYRLHGASKTVSLSVRFIDDFASILSSAVDRNLLSQRQAASYACLFAARVYLTPEAWNPAMAREKLLDTIRACPATWPSATFVLLKALARRTVGERGWSKARFLHTKLR